MSDTMCVGAHWSAHHHQYHRTAQCPHSHNYAEAVQARLCRTRQDHSQSQEGMRAAVRAQDEASAENRILLQTNHALQEETRISKVRAATPW